MIVHDYLSGIHYATKRKSIDKNHLRRGPITRLKYSEQYYNKADATVATKYVLGDESVAKELIRVWNEYKLRKFIGGEGWTFKVLEMERIK